MDPLKYALMAIALFAVGCITALCIWRALHGLYNRLRDDRDADRATKRYKEQSKAIRKSFDKR